MNAGTSNQFGHEHRPSETSTTLSIVNFLRNLFFNTFNGNKKHLRPLNLVGGQFFF
jgi:hypothetical protein